jgi:signal transduction histidine kinase
VHDWRNALQEIKACVGLARMEMGTGADIGEYLHGIERVNRRFGRLLDDVCIYTAPIRLDPEVLDISAIWKGAWNSLREQGQVESAALEEAADEGDLMACVDPRSVGEAFRRVFLHALAHSEGSQPVILRAGKEGERMLRIGIGPAGPAPRMGEEMQLFEPFHRDRSRGGLELAIARRFMEANGGQVGLALSGTMTEIFVLLPEA